MSEAVVGTVRVPPNACLFVKNVVVFSFCLVSLLSVYDRFDRTKQTFLRLHSQIVGVYPYESPAPCALATPSASELTIAVGRFPRTPWVDDPTEEDAYDAIEASLCGSDSIHSFLKHLSRNSSLVTAADAGGTTYNGAEVSLLNMLCGEDLDTRRDVYGDIRMRIARAYMHSNAAFVKYATGCWATPTPPFSAEVCGAVTSALVTEHMNAAAVDTLAAGQHNAATFPETGDMLARLLMLAAISEADRAVNGGACFGNPLSLNASQFCAATYKERIGAAPLFVESVSPPPAAPTTLDTRTAPYENVMQRYGRTCGDVSAALSDPPSPPPIPSFVWDRPEGDDPAVLACTHVLTFGLLDQRRLFGVPDPRDLFAVDTSWADYLSALLYRLTGLGLLDDDPWDERQNSLPTRLLLYSAHRLAATTALCTLTGFSMGFFATWAGMPLFVFFVARLTGKADIFGTTNPLVRPPPGISFWLMVIVAFLASSWAIFVEPPKHMSPHYTDKSCAARKDTSSPWATTSVDVSASDWWIAYVPFAIAVYAVIYAQFIRGGKCNLELRRRMANMFRIADPRSAAMGIAVITQALVILFLALGAGTSGAAWFEAAIEKRHLSVVGMQTADLVAKDCLVLSVGSIFVGACIGALCTRWTVTKQEAIMFKLPYAIVVFGCCFFPFLLQYSLVITNDQSTPGRGAYFVATLIAQAATGAFAFVNLLVFATVPVASVVNKVPKLEAGTPLPVARPLPPPMLARPPPRPSGPQPPPPRPIKLTRRNAFVDPPPPPRPAQLTRQNAFVPRDPLVQGGRRPGGFRESAIDAEQKLPLLSIRN